jgi:hypothetical protein
LLALTRRDAARGFTDDLQQPHQRKIEGRSVSKSARALPCAICAASRAASSM